MDIRIIPQKLRGAVTPPASKSMAHRAVLAMALAGGTGTLSNLSDSQDIQATKRCVAALKDPRPGGELPFMDCGESGSTLRFLIPIALADKKRAGDSITLVIPRKIGVCELKKVPVTELLPIIAAGVEG